VIPYEKYPGLSPLFLDFLRGLPEFFPDPPTLEAAAERGRKLLAEGARARVPASAFRHRGGEAAHMAEELAAGRAVAVSAGQQVGIFTGPLFTLVKAFDAIHLARALSRRGVPAVPVFWALTDDHDLQEVARTARPSGDGAQVLVLEGADRQNRRPVGPLPIPEGILGIVDAFREDARAAGAEAILGAFARRSAPGVSYGDAFIETLLDLVDPDPLLVLEPLDPALRAPTVELFLAAAKNAAPIAQILRATEEKLRRAGKPVPAPLPDGFSFFAIDRDGRRRIEDLPAAIGRIERAEALPSADVITRPALKSYLFPMAASVLGAAEIAYHAQSLPLFRVLGVTPPVLIPRTHVVLRSPAERRLAEALGLPEEELLAAAAKAAPLSVPEAEALEAISRSAQGELSGLSARLEKLDASLSGALENARRKIAYQFEQLAERARKAVERRGDVATGRHQRLERLLMPGAAPYERTFPPLTPMLAWGDGVRDALRRAAGDSTRGAVVVDVGLEGGGANAG
jgi:bacillithiol biosynthesis cysteine-adding enzyme BshC